MASIIFSAKDIFEQDFATAVRGYNKKDVDEFLDDIIKDYETYAALVKELREENKRLKAALEEASVRQQEAVEIKVEPTPVAPMMNDLRQQATGSVTNFDILRRLNRLEKEVFGRQIMDSEL